MGFPSQPQPAKPRWRRMALSPQGVRGEQRGEREKLKGEERGGGKKVRADTCTERERGRGGVQKIRATRE